MSERNGKIERMVDQGKNHQQHGYEPKYDTSGTPPQGGSVVNPPSAPTSGNPTPTPSGSSDKKE